MQEAATGPEPGNRTLVLRLLVGQCEVMVTGEAENQEKGRMAVRGEVRREEAAVVTANGRPGLVVTLESPPRGQGRGPERGQGAAGLHSVRPSQRPLFGL